MILEIVGEPELFRELRFLNHKAVALLPAVALALVDLLEARTNGLEVVAVERDVERALRHVCFFSLGDG